jgi:nucleolar MIF4G domain-containing protein 1
LTSHKVIAHEPLRVSLDDLHKADSKGKWWLVGAAWGGDPLVERQETAAVARPVKTTAASESDILLQLARKQGMNTDIRRSIFVVLMSSEVWMNLIMIIYVD